MPSLNRTSVGLKLDVLVHMRLHGQRPQSNQRGIETGEIPAPALDPGAGPQSNQRGIETGDGRPSGGSGVPPQSNQRGIETRAGSPRRATRRGVPQSNQRGIETSVRPTIGRER